MFLFQESIVGISGRLHVRGVVYLEFKIYTDDRAGVCKVLDEFIRIADEEFSKSKVLKAWKKVSGALHGPDVPEFTLNYCMRNGYVSFFVLGTFAMKLFGSASGKLKEYLMKSFDAKGVKVDRIDIIP